MENWNYLSPIQNQKMTCYGGVAAAAALPSLPPTTLTTLPSSSSNTSVRVRVSTKPISLFGFWCLPRRRWWNVIFLFFSFLFWEQDVGSGGAEHPNTVLKPTVDGFKWRLLISYDGTHYKGFFPLVPTYHSLSFLELPNF